MGRKRKLYLGIKPIGRCAIKSRRLARHITSQYHIIQNEKNILESHNIHRHDTNISTTATSESSRNSINNSIHSKNNVMCSNDNRSRNITMNIYNNDDIHHSNKKISASNILLSEEEKRKKRMEELDKQMDDIGGTNAYQQASIINTQHFKTSKWVYDVINNELHMISNETVVVATTSTGAAGATASVMKNMRRENRKELNEKSGSIRMKGNNDSINNNNNNNNNDDDDDDDDDDDNDDDDGRIIVDNRLKVLEVGAINTQLQKYNQYLNIRAIDLHSQHPLIEECDFFSIIPKQCYDVVVCSMVSMLLSR